MFPFGRLRSRNSRAILSARDRSDCCASRCARSNELTAAAIPDSVTARTRSRDRCWLFTGDRVPRTPQAASGFRTAFAANRSAPRTDRLRPARGLRVRRVSSPSLCRGDGAHACDPGPVIPFPERFARGWNEDVERTPRTRDRVDWGFTGDRLRVRGLRISWKWGKW